MSYNIATANRWTTITKNEDRVTAKVLTFAAKVLAPVTLTEAHETVTALTADLGSIRSIPESKGKVSALRTVATVLMVEGGYTADELTDALAKNRRRASEWSTLYTAYGVAKKQGREDDAAYIVSLVESGKNLRKKDDDGEDDDGEGKAKDEGLSAIMTAVHAARKRGVSDADIVAAIEAL